MFTRRVPVLALFLLTVLTNFPTQALAAEPLTAGQLADTLDTLLDNHPTAKRTTVTLKVVDLETGEVLYDRGGNKLLTPASNLKIYTASAALDLLGPDYRWPTEIIAGGAVSRGTCTGDLWIRGFGDPMLDSEQLESIADELVKTQRLKRVNGGVRVAINHRWGSVPLKGPGWMWDDDPDYYNMSIRPVMLNFNTLDVVASPGQKGVKVSLEPKTAWPSVVVKPSTDSNDKGVSFEREPFEETIYVTGTLEAGSDPVRETITMHDPSLWISAVFKQILIDRGVKFKESESRPSSSVVIGADANSLVTHESKTLAEALKHFLKVSENAVGEMVLLKLAETQTREAVSWPTGVKVISDWLINTAGLEAGSFRLVDGSGLSRYNLISADSSVKLLAFMKSHKHFEPFFDGLPIYKVTLPEAETWHGKPLKDYNPERVFAKPGGMSGVSTISGYIKTLDGQWLAFSLLGNGYIGSSKPVRDLRNEVWGELVRYKPAD